MQDIVFVNSFGYLLAPVGQSATASGGGSGSGVQQVYNDEPTPDDTSKPALSYPTGGGTLTQWNGSAWV